MKKFKSLITVLLLVLVAVVLVPTAFAVIESSSKGTIDLSGIKEEVTVNAYRLMNVNIDDSTHQPQQPVYSWIDDGEKSVAKWIAGNEKYKKYIDTENGNAVTKEFNDKDLTNTTDLADFYKDLAAAIKGGSVEIKTANTKTIQASGTGSDKIENAEMGNYLIVIENGQKYVYNESSVNVVPEYKNGAWNVSTPNKVVIKFTEPTIEKVTTGEATEAEAKIGDKVPYTITVDVPNYKEDAKAKTITIKDTFSSGLTFNDDVVVIVKKGDSTKTLVAGTDYTLVKEGIEETFQVKFNDAQYECVFKGQCTEEDPVSADLLYDEIVVTYSGTVNENAINGLDETTNSAVLEWNNDPTSTETSETDPSVVEVYTYNIKVNKVDGDNNNAPLPGAKFSVSQNGTKLKFVKVSDGVYRLATTETVDNDACETDTTKACDILTVNSTDGTLQVKGLKSGTYTVTEEEAPAGYVKLQNPRDFVITDADQEGKLDGVIEGSNDNTKEDTIVNTKGSTLPVTGGIGTLIFSIVGIVFMGIGAFLIKNILKKKEVQNI